MIDSTEIWVLSLPYLAVHTNLLLIWLFFFFFASILTFVCTFQAELSRLSEIENSLAIFCMATYGEGDPTDNAQDFYDWLQENDDEDLSGLNYTVSLNIWKIKHCIASDHALKILVGISKYHVGLLNLSKIWNDASKFWEPFHYLHGTFNFPSWMQHSNDI